MTKARTLADNFAADINAVSAGTGITGGGTSGTVTVTNSMATAIDAKGDLVVGTGADTFSRLAVGANDTVLVAASGEATGLKWAAPASGSTFVGASVSNSTTQAISNNTHTAVTWDTEEFDTDAFHSTATNTSRFTIPAGKGGKYLFNCSVRWDNNGSSDRILEIYKNGTIFAALDVLTGNYPGYMVSRTLNLVATDYVELYVYQNSGGSRTLELGGIRGWAELLYLGA